MTFHYSELQGGSLIIHYGKNFIFKGKSNISLILDDLHVENEDFYTGWEEFNLHL